MRPVFVVAVLCLAASLRAENASAPMGDPVLEPPTLRSLGVYWIIKGDDNANATIEVEFSAKGDAKPHRAMPLVRVEKGAHKLEKLETTLKVPDDAWLFAGSVLLLKPGTEYQIVLRLKDADGGSAEKTLTARTRVEPVLPSGITVRHVKPGAGGGKGTADDPFAGMKGAIASAKPGDVFHLASGTYPAFVIERGGTPELPIVFRSAPGAAVVIDGANPEGKRGRRGIIVGNTHDVWIENVTVRNFDLGIVINDSARVVVRRCKIENVDYGINATYNEKLGLEDCFFSDNEISGPSTWPRTKGIESARGIQVSGKGHVVCYNRIRAFADAIDTFPSRICAAIDIHNNDLSELTDDGIEMDYSERNTRSFHNKLTNVYQGITMQPIHGGPVYAFRNVMVNVCVEPFKLHNSPSGGWMLHNTIVKKGSPLLVSTSAPMRHCVSRNNLYVGTEANYVIEMEPEMRNCDFDYDGFAGGPFKLFMKWGKVRYKTVEQVRKDAPAYRNVVELKSEGLFAGPLAPPTDEKKMTTFNVKDAALAAGSSAIDAGVAIPNLNDDATGKAPDLGAFEFGGEIPHYGPRAGNEK